MCESWRTASSARLAWPRNDRNAGKTPSQLTIGQDLSKHRDNDNGCREIIQSGGKKKRYDAYDPHQLERALRFDPLGYELKTITSIDQLDQRHRPEQEKQNSRHLTEMLEKLMADLFFIWLKQDINRPA